MIGLDERSKLRWCFLKVKQKFYFLGSQEFYLLVSQVKVYIHGGDWVAEIEWCGFKPGHGHSQPPKVSKSPLLPLKFPSCNPWLHQISTWVVDRTSTQTWLWSQAITRMSYFTRLGDDKRNQSQIFESSMKAMMAFCVNFGRNLLAPMAKGYICATPDLHDDNSSPYSLRNHQNRSLYSIGVNIPFLMCTQKIWLSKMLILKSAIRGALLRSFWCQASTKDN